MEEKIEYTETINYVVTTQPDLVAGYIDELNERIAELEQELAELKEKSITPQFKLGQTVFTANKPNECIYKLKIISIHIERNEFNNRIVNSLVYRAERIKDGCIGGYSEDELFATEQEALNKLKEMNGNV